LEPITGAVQRVDSLGLLIAVPCAFERNMFIGGRHDRVRLGRYYFHPIGEVQSLFDDVRDALLGLLHAGSALEQLLVRSDIAGAAGDL